MAALRNSDTQSFAEAAARVPSFQTLAKVGLTYALQGVTSVDEVLTLAAGTPVYDDLGVTKDSFELSEQP